MGEIYVIANQVVNEKLAKRALFTTEEINHEILQRGGILRIATCCPVKCYINELLNQGLLELIKPKGQDNVFYQAVPVFANLINANPVAIDKGLKADTLISLSKLKDLLN